MNLVIASRQRTKKVNLRHLRAIVETLLAELQIHDADLGIHLVGATEMARVNWQFLQHEGSTDVITFDHLEPGTGAAGNPVRPLHGELFVCVDDAVAQARQFKTTWQAEVVRYVVHGILHLTGHDDLKADLRRQMKRAENRLVRRLAKKFSFADLARSAKLGA